jgi:hypothetical protein
MHRISAPLAATPFVLLSSLALAACGGSPGSSSSGPGGSPSSDAGTPVAPDARADAAPDGGGDAGPAVDGAPNGDAGDDAPQPVAVSGHAVDLQNASQPLVARTLVVIDATGTPFWTTTSATGAFSVAGVLPPYDVVVAAPPYPGGHRYAFIGVSTPHPRVFGGPDSEPVYPREHTAQLSVPIDLPACGTAECNVNFAYADLSNGGHEFTSGGFTKYTNSGLGGWGLAPFWYGSGTVAQLGLEVLVTDVPASRFWFASSNVGQVADGSVVSAQQVTPSPVTTLDDATVAASEVNVPAQWRSPSLALWLDYPQNFGSGTALLTSAPAASLVSGVPDIAGAMLHATANTTSPPDPNFYGSSTAASPRVPLTSTNVALTLYGPPTATHPQPGGQLSTSGVIDWTGVPAKQVVDVEVYDQASDSYELDVYAAGTSVDLKRLAVAGVSIATGAKAINLSSKGDVPSLDAMLDENTLASPDGSHDELVTIHFNAIP